MRYLVAGIGPDGRSRIVEERDVSPPLVADEGIAVAKLFASEAGVPPSGSPGLSHFTPKRLAPGQVSLQIVEHRPRAADAPPSARTLHYGNAIDIVTILDGEGAMELGDGLHPLGPGDCIMMPGVDHAFRPAPGGCRLTVFSIGMTIAPGDTIEMP